MLSNILPRYTSSLAVLFLSLAASAQTTNLTVVPTTTLTSETRNNTSAPDAINTATRGYAASGSISKLPIKSLLYSGATTKIYAALMGWFGKSSHLAVGYNSQDATQVQKQVEDMQSRGIDGAILAWYGQGSYEDRTGLVLKTQAETHTNFSFILMIDQGTIQWNSQGLAPTDAMIFHLNYMAQTYYSSPAYGRMNGRPVVLEFGTEAWPIDWTRVLASIQGNPVIIFRNPPAFTNTNAYGGYGWGPADGLSYTDYFNQTANQHKDKIVMADGWKGFNDVLAAWSQNRVVDQQCGQTWLNSMAELSKYYSAANPLPFLQIPTWNDYEEGTTIESGIDNCVTLSATTSGTQLQWQLGGAGLENTIDHYTVFASTDGENLMPLADVPTGTHSLDLGAFNLAAGDYTLYVKATGRSSLKNQMSNAALFTKPNLAPTAVLSATPSSGLSGMTVTASTAASSDVDGTVASSLINFGDGTVMNGPSASHVYPTPGTYTVTARVTDNLGASASATQTVTILNQAPHAALSTTPNTGYAPTTVSASTAGSMDTDGTISSTTIDFGDGVIIAGTSASHQYANAGTYTVTARVTDNLGAVSIATNTVRIAPAAVTITLPSTQPDSATPLHVIASAVSGRPITGMWVYLDNVGIYGNHSSSLDIYITVKAGTHVLQVKAWDNTGHITSSSVTINVVAGSIAPRTARTTSATETTAARLAGATAPVLSADSAPLEPRAARLGR